MTDAKIDHNEIHARAVNVLATGAPGIRIETALLAGDVLALLAECGRLEAERDEWMEAALNPTRLRVNDRQGHR